MLYCGCPWTQSHSVILLPGATLKRPQVPPCPSTNWGYSENNFCLLEISSTIQSDAASLVAQMIKCLSAVWETQVWSLGWEYPWRRIWQPTPLLLPRKSHGWRILVVYSPRDSRVGHDWVTSLHFPSPNTRKATVYTNILSLTSIKTSVRKNSGIGFSLDIHQELVNIRHRAIHWQDTTPFPNSTLSTW